MLFLIDLVVQVHIVCGRQAKQPLYGAGLAFLDGPPDTQSIGGVALENIRRLQHLAA